MEAIPAAGEQLVNVALMTHVPDEFVSWCVENPMQSDSQLDDTKVRAEMTAILRQHGDHLLTDFRGELLQLFNCQLLQMNRTIHHIEVSAHRLIISRRQPVFS